MEFGSFYILVANNAAVNVGEQIQLWDIAFNSFGCKPRSGIAESHGNSTFIWKKFNNFYICVGVLGLSLVEENGGYSSLRCSRLLISGASPCRGWVLGHAGFSSWGSSALGSGLGVGRRILSTGEVLFEVFWGATILFYHYIFNKLTYLGDILHLKKNWLNCPVIVMCIFCWYEGSAFCLGCYI